MFDFITEMKRFLCSSLFFMFDIHNILTDVIEEEVTLGLGSNSTVKLGFDCLEWDLIPRRYNNQAVALKIFKSNDPAATVEALNEVSVYSRLKNQPHVVNCYGIYYKEGAPVIVLEKAEKSLYNLYREEKVNRVQYSFCLASH